MSRSKRRTKLALAAVVALVAHAAPARAQATLWGYVRDSSARALEQVVVSVSTGREARSDATGQFLLRDLPKGTVILTARLVGHEPYEARVDLPAAGTVRHEIVLRPLPLRLDSVVTRARAADHAGIGFAAMSYRQKLGFGKFVDSTTLRRNEHRRLGDLLQGIPGVKIMSPLVCGARGTCRPDLVRRVAVSSRREAEGICPLQVFVDGVLRYRAPEPGSFNDWDRTFDLGEVPISHLAGVEVFRSAAEVPPEYGGSGAGCGVLLLWTRRG